MTAKEKLHAIETAIRKALPRLMEPTIGCWFKNPKEIGFEKLVGIDGKRYYFQYDNGIYFNSSVPKDFEIIGHDVLLSDVLEWSSKTFKNFRKLLIDDNGILYKFLINGMFGDAGGVYWDLSKPRLSDQSEELINFLYNLIKE